MLVIFVFVPFWPGPTVATRFLALSGLRGPGRGRAGAGRGRREAKREAGERGQGSLGHWRRSRRRGASERRDPFVTRPTTGASAARSAIGHDRGPTVTLPTLLTYCSLDNSAIRLRFTLQHAFRSWTRSK